MIPIQLRLSRNHVRVGVFLFLVALSMNPLLVQEGLQMDERSIVYVPDRVFNARCLAEGHLPLWNPYAFFGSPHIATHQNGFFYPPNLVLYGLLSPLMAAKWSVALHLFLAGWFMFLYLRRLRTGLMAAAGGGLFYILSGYLLAHEGHVSVQNTACLVPLLFYFAEGSLQRRDRWNFAGGAATLACLVFAGYLHVVVMAGMMLAVYAIVYLLIGCPPHRFRALLGLAGILVAGSLLSAVQVLTTRDFLPDTLRMELTYEAFSTGYFPFSHLPLMAFPLLFGGNGGFALPPYRGAFNTAEITGWIGVLPLILAVLGFWCLRKGRRRAAVWAWLLIGGFSLLLSFGGQTPLYRLMFSVPVYNMFRTPAKNLLHLDLALAALAGLGLHVLLVSYRRNTPRFRRIVKRLPLALLWTALALGLILKAATLVGIRSWPETRIQDWPRYLSFRNPAVWVPFAVLLVQAVSFWLWARWRRHAILILSVIVLTGEALFLKQSLNGRPVPQDILYERPEKNETLTFLRSREPDLDAFRVYTVTAAIGDGCFQTLFPMLNVNYGVRSLTGYGPLFPSGLAAVIGVACTANVNNQAQFLADNRLFSVMNVKYILIWPISDETRRIDAILRSAHGPDNRPCYALVHIASNGAKVYENLLAVPRAYAVQRVFSASSSEDPKKSLLETAYYFYNTANSFDLKSEAVLVGPLPSRISGKYGPATVSIRNDGPNVIRAQVDAAEKTFLVVAELFLPGWQAYVDGKRERTYPVNCLLTGLKVPAGKHEVVLRYKPRAFVVGAYVSLATLAFLLLVVLAPRRVFEGAWEAAWAALCRRAGISGGYPVRGQWAPEGPGVPAGSAAATKSTPSLLSVVIPVYNEQSCIGALFEALQGPLKETGLEYEILFVNDGSRDGSLALLKGLAAKSPRVKVLSFSRNFGHQAALCAGLDFARGDAVVMMDADLQHPPEMIPALVREWRAGAWIVYTVRQETRDATAFKKFTSWLFYRLFRRLSGLDLDFGAADFRLLDRRVVQVLVSLHERNQFLRGLVKWVGFPQKALPYTAAERAAGTSKYSAYRMIRFALLGIVSFSTVPLKMATFLGFFLSFLSLIWILFTIYAKFFMSHVIQGWTSTMMAVLLMGGIQLLCLGVLGEYLGQIYDEVKHRPRYIVMETVNVDSPSEETS